MSKPKDGGPAFPTEQYGSFGGGPHVKGGMSLRDWFAGMVLTGLLSRMPENGVAEESVPVLAFKYADQMLNQRNLPTEE